MSEGWKYYSLDQGDTAEDAVTLRGHCVDAEDAAMRASEEDFHENGQYEPDNTPFKIAIIAPNNTETVWKCSHEMVVHFAVHPVEDETP